MIGLQAMISHATSPRSSFRSTSNRKDVFQLRFGQTTPLISRGFIWLRYDIELDSKFATNTAAPRHCQLHAYQLTDDTRTTTIVSKNLPMLRLLLLSNAT
ncbi:unnamed protein product, partial [Mesorhabditis spiculigera]